MKPKRTPKTKSTKAETAPSKPKAFTLTMDRREFNTVLAALRYWQGWLMGDQHAYDCVGLSSDGGVLPLDEDEIDALIERIN